MADAPHLHVRSGFSYGIGTATPEELVQRAAELGMSTVALTDRDGLYGIPRFLRACRETGISPIVGAEITVEAFGARGHIVLLANSDRGYRTLCRLITSYRLSSEARREPACPVQSLLEHTAGLVCLTGAVPFGLLPRFLLARDAVLRRKSRRLALLLREAFNERLYVELSDDRTEGSRRRIARTADFSAEIGLPVVATGEVTYLSRADHRLYDALVAAANLTALPGPGYRPTDRLHLAPPDEMHRMFADRPEALRNAVMIADRCGDAVKLDGKVHMPAVRLSPDEDADRKLFVLTMHGARRKYGRLDGRVVSRLRRELSCIEDLGFAPYLLIAHEAVGIAREKGVPVTGRGSAANSVVAYALDLTQPEPLSNRLLFERFMHEQRRDVPDIDLDLCSRRRDEVRNELMRRYQKVGAAVAATAGTMSLRGAVRVAARALGHTPREIDELARHVPTRVRDRDRELYPVAGWDEALREPAMRAHPLQDREKYRLLLDLSWRLKGRLHKAGTHLAGVVFGTQDRHLSEFVPLEPSGTPELVRCQFDKEDLEFVGLPKLDLLGLRMHTALHEAGELASRRIGKRVDALAPPQDDRETYALLRTGKTAGIFQLESPGQMSLSRRLKPRRFGDIVASISLFRPGPIRGDLTTPYVMRRNGREAYGVPLPELDEILRPTHGVLIYQEQVLEVASVAAGFSFAEGDELRRAMTKDRGPEAMRGIRKEFVRRARSKGVPPEKAALVFDWVEGFASYGFSAAHAASFGEIAYASAYMRTHYSAEFFAGVLNSQPMGFYSPRTVLNEARRAGIGVLAPHIHLSGDGFVVEDDGRALRVGLRYSKGLSHRAIDSILEERESRPFESVADLYRRADVGQDALKNLIQAGFLDVLDPDGNRATLLAQTGYLPRKPRDRDRQRELPHPASRWEGRNGLGARVYHLPPSAADLESAQWEALRLNVVRHPLLPFRDALEKSGVAPSYRILDLPHSTRSRAAGIIECLQRPPTKSGIPVYFLLVEDEWGLLQTTIFEKTYRRYGDLLHHRGAFLLDGRVEQDPRRGFSFVVDRIADLWETLVGDDMPSPKAVSGAGALLQAGRRSRRAG